MNTLLSGAHSKGKKTQKRLSESEQRYQELANSLPNIYFETDMKGQVTFTNKMGYENSGYSQEEIEKGVNIMQFLSPEERERATKHIQLLLAGSNFLPLEYNFVRKDGATFPALITTVLIVCQNKVIGLRGLVSDITERKKVEDIVRQSEERYRDLANFLPEIVFETDLTGKITFFSNRALEITGFTRDELEKGINMLSFVAPEQRTTAALNMRNSMAGEKVGSNEYKLARKDGSTFFALVSTSPIISQNKVAGLRGIVIDITERKKAENELRESEAKFKELNSLLPEMVFEIDTRGNIVFANLRAFEITGYSKEDFEAGFNAIRLVAPEDLERAKENMQNMFTNEIRHSDEYLWIRKDGSRFSVSLSSSPIFKDKKIVGARAIIIDITERKKVEDIVRQSEERYRDLANSLPEIVFETDLTGKITFFNQRAMEVSGFTRADGEKGLNLLSFIVPEDRERATAINIRKTLMGEKVGSNEYKLARKDGSTFFALVSTSPIIYENKVIGLRGVAIDITERKKTEENLKQAKDELVLVNEKLNVMGRLTRHDIRNKLTGLGGNVHILKKTHSDSADIMARLNAIDQACKSIMQILDFSKIYEALGSKELVFVDVEKTVDEAIALFSARPNLKIINECRGLTVLADSFLRELFYNLIDNSMKHGERVTKIRVHYEKMNQDKLSLIYEDNGVGVSVDNKSRLFREGFSTSGSTGYGLYLTRKTMDVYGWAIQENGEPKKGAKFTITIAKLNKDGKENYQIFQ